MKREEVCCSLAIDPSCVPLLPSSYPRVLRYCACPDSSIRIQCVSGAVAAAAGAQAREVSRLKRYFERLHFTPGVPGGFLGENFAGPADPSGNGVSRFHWLSRERFDRGEFATERYRCLAALQRLAFTWCLNTRLGESAATNEQRRWAQDLHQMISELVLRTPSTAVEDRSKLWAWRDAQNAGR